MLRIVHIFSDPQPKSIRHGPKVIEKLNVLDVKHSVLNSESKNNISDSWS